MSQESATARLRQLHRQSPASIADNWARYPRHPIGGLSRVLRSFYRPLPKAEKRKDGQDHDDQANEIDQTVHNNLLRPATLPIARSPEGSSTDAGTYEDHKNTRKLQLFQTVSPAPFIM